MHRMELEFPADNKRLGKILYALAHCSVSPEISIEYTVADPEKSKEIKAENYFIRCYGRKTI